MNKHLDIFYVDLVVTACQMGENHIWMQGDLDIKFNNEKPYADSDIINIEEFLNSIHSDGEFEIFSCCCGVPECSGWIKGIEVLHIDNQFVKWTNLNNGKTWLFEKQSLEEGMKQVEEEVENYKKFFKEKGIDYVGYGY
ncbi:MAG: hypothetical protein L0G39_16645 [Chryseobacterium sp.]|nr:hypothetical protein [Chryseobacterium sp.]